MVKDKFSDKDEYVEIKLFPGLKVTSRYIPTEQFKSNLNIAKTNCILRLDAVFSHRFKESVRFLHEKLK